jgi:GNAT superfamily N-acetyltransferase
VSRLELVPFAEEHLDAATVLLADAHDAHRAAEPLLAPADARTEVERVWSRDAVGGMIAFRGGSPTGYLVGREAENATWDRHVFVDRAGHAAADAETLRGLWTAAAEAWWDHGIRRFFANVPSTTERLDPWYRLGFAQMHQDGIRATSGGGEPTLPADVTIRRGGLEDIETAILINRLIAETQLVAPSFSGLEPSDERADWIETLEDPTVAWFVAERDGEPLGHATLYEPGPDLGTPTDSVFLASTATLPEARGLGVGLALTDHALAWSRESGYGTIVTNWRVTNLLASRFWPARGFRPSYVRLHRAPGVA